MMIGHQDRRQAEDGWRESVVVGEHSGRAQKEVAKASWSVRKRKCRA